MLTPPQDFRLFRMKTCIHYALFACQDGASYYNPGLKTTQSVGPQSNRCKRSACRSPGILPGLCTLLRRGCQAPSSASCLGFSCSLAVQNGKAETRGRTLDTNGWKIRSRQKPGLEHDAVQTGWIWQAKGGVAGLNEAASVRVGSMRHLSNPSIPSIASPFHRSLSASQFCRSSFHLRCQAGYHVLHVPTPLVFSICHRKKPWYWWSTKCQPHQQAKKGSAECFGHADITRKQRREEICFRKYRHPFWKGFQKYCHPIENFPHGDPAPCFMVTLLLGGLCLWFSVPSHNRALCAHYITKDHHWSNESTVTKSWGKSEGERPRRTYFVVHYDSLCSK